jgi:hypothetical protein
VTVLETLLQGGAAAGRTFLPGEPRQKSFLFELPSFLGAAPLVSF